MKLAGFVFALAAVPVAAQSTPYNSTPHNGVRVGGSVAYLAASSDIREPVYTDPDARRIAQLLLARREQAQAQAKCSGAVPLTIHADGSSTEQLSEDAPCIAFETWAEERSSDYAESVQTGFTGIERRDGKTVLRRFVRDGLRQIYVSYAVTVETLAGGSYRLSFGPSSDQPPADLRGKTDWALLMPPKFSVPQTMKDEDSVRLVLYSDGNPDNTTRELVDYIHAGREDRMVMRKEAPRDYYAEDAELSFTHPHLRVNGVAYDAVVPLPDTIRGPLVWVYVPGYGRYVLSLHPREELGFESAGEAAGGALTFTSQGNVFRIDTAERVAAGSGTYTVHVLPDLSWMPADPLDRTRVTIGAAPGV